MRDTIEKLIRKNEKLKCKLGKMRREKIATVVSVAAAIAVGFVIELCFNQVKNVKGGGEDK